VTGHTHVIPKEHEGESVFDNCDLYVDEQGNMFLERKDKSGPLVITHDEHGTTTLDPAKKYRVTRQREYDAIEEARERRVRD